MVYDVRCAYCGGVYNVGNVKVIARYTDCSVWKAPCCGRTVDDRGETGWKSTKDYYRLDKDELTPYDEDMAMMLGIPPSLARRVRFKIEK